MPQHIDEDQPTHWFEPLYANANQEGDGVPWANMKTHPAFDRWLGKHPLHGAGKTALVIGCGMGDDAIALEKLGFEVTAFDISETAIHYCKTRFPDSSVNFMVADLFAPHASWHQKFDFVLEIFTIQALPPKYEEALIRTISGFVSENGELLVIAVVSPEARDFQKGPPWVLTTEHIEGFQCCGLEVVESDVIKNDTPQNSRETHITTFRR